MDIRYRYSTTVSLHYLLTLNYNVLWQQDFRTSSLLCSQSKDYETIISCSSLQYSMVLNGTVLWVLTDNKKKIIYQIQYLSLFVKVTVTCRTVTFPPSGSRWLQKTIKARRSLCVLQFLGVYSIKVSYNQRVVCVLQWVSKLGVNWKYIIIFHYTYFLGAFVFVDIFSSVKCVKVEKHCLTESSYSHMYYTQNMIQNSFSKTSRDNTI